MHGCTLEEPSAPDLSKEDHRLTSPHRLSNGVRDNREKSLDLCQDRVVRYQLVPVSSVLMSSSFL